MLPVLLGGIWINARGRIREELYLITGVGEGPPLSWGAQVPLESGAGQLRGAVTSLSRDRGCGGWEDWRIPQPPSEENWTAAMAMIEIIKPRIKTWRRSQGKLTFVFTTTWVPLPSVCVTFVSDVYLYPMQSLPDGHVPGMRMDRGVSMPNMLEPKASADVIHFPSRHWRFYCEMQIKYGKCLSSLVFLYVTSVPAPYVPNLSLCSALCSAGVSAQAGWGQPRCDSRVKEALLGAKGWIWKVLHSWFSVRLSPAKAPGQTQLEGLRSVQFEKCCRTLCLTTHCWGCLNSKDYGKSLAGSKIPTCLSGSAP